MRVEELTGAQLDYLVARAEGLEAKIVSFRHDSEAWSSCKAEGRLGAYLYSPSTTWRHGGLIIDRKAIGVHPYGTNWRATAGGCSVIGPTALVAAMRAYVTSMFGEEVADEVAAGEVA